MNKTVRDLPIFGVLTIVAVFFMAWTGYILAFRLSHLAATHVNTYQAPNSLLDLQTWGYLFLASAALMLFRLFLDVPSVALGLILHGVPMIVALAWAVSLDLGPLAVAQPAFTALAMIIFGIPFVPTVIDARFGGYRPPLK